MRMRPWLITLLLLTVPLATQAEVDTRILRTLNLTAKPLDLAIPGNGRYIYVLTADAKLQVFMGDGQLRDTIAVEAGVDRIQPGPREDLIYLVDSTNNRIQVLYLDFIQEIPVGGSPTKGPAAAPITVAVFTDFE